jgi:hypothetical protein
MNFHFMLQSLSNVFALRVRQNSVWNYSTFKVTKNNPEKSILKIDLQSFSSVQVIYTKEEQTIKYILYQCHTPQLPIIIMVIET